jgi:2-polyprenyl-6-methoxyphenol hydroxylase-like FAD-dependent oxidoreductase
VYGFLDTSNRYRRFERRGASPDGFVVVGDAASSFNPVYGHGLAAAAMQAVAMRDVLAKTGLRYGFSAAAQQAIARASLTPWQTATAVDRRYLAEAAAEAGSGTRATVTGRLSRWFNDRLLAHCATNQQVAEAVHGVYGLALPPTRLLSPAVALRTLVLAPGPGHTDPPGQAFDSRPGAA